MGDKKSIGIMSAVFRLNAHPFSKCPVLDRYLLMLLSKLNEEVRHGGGKLVCAFECGDAGKKKKEDR